MEETKKVVEKKARVFKTTEAGDLKKYSEAMVQQKVYFTVRASVSKEGAITFIFTTVPITDTKRKAIQTIINKA